ncbi:uncharacterized protein Bfra_001277 [Botrytis fragariae]|uniref:Uncharacterized protein n=1 Tax=Botrytis fragariae TaxID=1964551 RepID=A0A8H6B0H5_9HELO|nr:uncharacterized protein Bfra_001277 [Botrytis fragariae]KAF5876919.1 hypothetical protein Bfra_001277 [Botrytis fragariae]
MTPWAVRRAEKFLSAVLECRCSRDARDYLKTWYSKTNVFFLVVQLLVFSVSWWATSKWSLGTDLQPASLCCQCFSSALVVLDLVSLFSYRLRAAEFGFAIFNSVVAGFSLITMLYIDHEKKKEDRKWKEGPGELASLILALFDICLLALVIIRLRAIEAQAKREMMKRERSARDPAWCCSGLDHACTESSGQGTASRAPTEFDVHGRCRALSISSSWESPCEREEQMNSDLIDPLAAWELKDGQITSYQLLQH